MQASTAFHPLNSSMCDGVAQDGEHLLVRFSAGKVYRYIGAAHHLDALVSAESVGRFVNGMLKPNHECERAIEHE